MRVATTRSTKQPTLLLQAHLDVLPAADDMFEITGEGKKLVGRNRPDHADAVPPYETSPSFPSGHTLNTTVVIGLVVYLACLQLKRTLARVGLIAAGVMFIVAMGMSRVYLGHHWMTDVIMGWVESLSNMENTYRNSYHAAA